MNKKNEIDLYKISDGIKLTVPSAPMPQLVKDIENDANEFIEENDTLNYEENGAFAMLRDALARKYGIVYSAKNSMDPRYTDMAYLTTMSETYKALTNFYGHTLFMSDLAIFLGVDPGTIGNEWAAEAGDRGKWVRSLKKYSENSLEHKAVGSKTTPPNVGAIFLLKAQHGYSEGNQANITINGAGVTDVKSLMEKYGSGEEDKTDSD